MKAFLIILLIILIIVVLAIMFPVITGRPSGDTRPGATLLASEDGGETWRNLEKFAGGEISVLRFDSEDPQFIFAGTARRGIWRGKRNDEGWRQFGQSLGEGARVFDILDPASDKKFTALVLSNQRGRIVSASEQEQKELLFTALERFAFFKGLASSDRRNIKVIGSDGGFYESRNSGETWSRLALFREGLVRFEINRLNPSEIWVADSRGSLFRSDNGGNKWTNLSGGLREFRGAEDVRVILFDSRAGILYHASRYGLLKSSNHGKSFETVALPLAPEVLPITSFALDPSNSSKLIAGASNQIFISADRGISWHASKIPADGSVSAILIDPENPKNIFIGLGAPERVR